MHEIVNHIERYVDGQVHTNGIENFWSLLKRTLNGTYVAVEPFHLERYVDEQVFRFNNRATKDNPLNDADRFHAGGVADCREAADLCRADWQGGRNEFLTLIGRSAGSAFPLLRLLLSVEFSLDLGVWERATRRTKFLNGLPVSFLAD